MHCTPTLLRISTLTAIASCAAAQSTFIVPANQLDLQPTIDAASPGDTIQLSGGSHWPFTLTKGLTIRGPGTVNADYYSVLRTTVIDIPLGEHAVLEDVQAVTRIFSPDPCAVPTRNVQVLGGRVSFVGCQIEGARPAALDVQGGDIAIQACTLTGQNGASGLAIQNARVAVSASSFQGSNWQAYSGPRYCGVTQAQPRPGIELGAGAELHGSDLDVRGGDGVDTTFMYYPLVVPPSPGLTQSSAGRVWITDSRVVGGDHPTSLPGAVAIRCADPVFIARSNLIGGNGSMQGAASQGPATVEPSLLGVEPLPFQFPRGTSETLRFTGPPTTPVALFVGDTPVASSTPLIRQPFWFGAGSASLLSAGMTDANGLFAQTLTVPTQTGLVGIRLWFHGFGGSALPVEAAPITTTVVR